MLHSPLLSTLAFIDHGFGLRTSPIPEDVRLLTQVHGTDILPSNTPEKEPAGDGWLVQTPGAVGIKTGDCLPILWAHPSTRSACALHCGWRSLAGGIIQKALTLIPDEGPLYIALGPCMGPHSYEVGKDVLDVFSDFPEAFRPIKEGKWLADLPAIAQAILMKNRPSVVIDQIAVDTYANPQLFNSYRRGDLTTRQVSWIRVKDV